MEAVKPRFFFGCGSDNYRIDLVDEKYIANFKTDKTPAQYLVRVKRLSTGEILGEFSFVTKK